MANPPKRHHYVPRFYLAGFTKSGTVDGDLFVLDQRQRKRWGPVSPASVAYGNDFYKIDVRPDADPMVIEKTFGAEVESECSKVIRAVIEQECLPTGTDHDILLNFVALMAVRVPAIRNIISAFVDDVTKDLTRTVLMNEEGWQQFKRNCEAGGEKVDCTWQEMKAFVDGDDYTVDLDRSWHVGVMLDAGSKLIPVLARRNWSIWITKDDAPDLICSDRPVCLTWYMSQPPPLPPGFAVPGTTVIMPINRRIAIAGTFEDQPSEATLDSNDVAVVNRSTREYANQIYSAEPDFVWAMTDEKVGTASELLELLKPSEPLPKEGPK